MAIRVETHEYEWCTGHKPRTQHGARSVPGSWSRACPGLDPGAGWAAPHHGRKARIYADDHWV
jgi:hypothetical protein